MGTSAAFFDLDRTLLKGASGPVISAALREAGIIPERHIPGEGAVYKIFDLFGENLASMAITRQAARVAAGWSGDAVREAGKAAAQVLTGMVQPYARMLMDEHRAAGRPVVLATTTPFDMIKALADELGLDDVIATTYGRDGEGLYDGTIAGSFVWGTGKLDAVRAWAERNGVDLKQSYAYSDSVFDSPLLAAVGHPTAVNPDASLRVVAAARRWPVLHFDAPPGVPKVLGVEPWQAMRPFMSPVSMPFVRFDIAGTELIPKEGAGIVVANHRSYFDTAAVGLTVAPSGRALRFLGKKEVFDAPVVGQLARAMGGIRVDRGTGSDEPLKAAARALEAGELVALMPQGTIPRGRAFFEPELKGRWGAARLAAMTGAPIVPLGIWGTERVWPRNARMPNVLNITNPPLVRCRVGRPFHVDGEDVDADTVRIMDAIVDLLPPEAKVRREPTTEELRRTIPSSFKGDPNTYGEDQHRPGQD
jgi:putative phosphoserine phosphatase/1-acylglycerol-3-phosphate O-acyltransferase